MARAMGGTERRGGIPMLALAALLPAALTGAAYWPGLMSWDPIRQYTEVLSGEIEDWHPPAMQWLWQRLLVIHPGPAPMLLLQLLLYWGGLFVLAAWAWRTRRGWLGPALLACGLFPPGLALTGAILKDSLMTGVLLAALACVALAGPEARRGPRIAGGLLLFAAATLRFNGFAACMPLLVALLPAATRRTAPRLCATAVLATLALLAAMPIANRLIGARPSGVSLSLVIFDLGGITERTGVDVFPPALHVPDPVRVNHGCYKPLKWDSYSDWVEPECPLGFTAWREAMPAGPSPYLPWARAIVAHPLAYAEHRLAHFAINTRLVPLPDAIERPVPVTDAPNPWGFHTHPNPALRAIDRLAVGFAHTPLGWPIVWIAAAASALWAGRRLAGAWLIVPLAASSCLYGMGYLVFSVAPEWRYHLWTGLGALLAGVLVAHDAKRADRRRVAIAYLPTAAVAGVAIVVRSLG